MRLVCGACATILRHVRVSGIYRRVSMEAVVDRTVHIHGSSECEYIIPVV